MKKFITNIYAVALVAMASATFTACSSDDAEDVQPAGKKVYTLTVNADKDADTRALAVDGDNITATWEAGDVVKVYNGTEEVGELTAQSSGASTTLSGEVTVDASVTSLTLKYKSADYNSQKGTLASIAENCDYGVATISGFTFEESNITSTTPAVFESQQAIRKFNIVDKADGTTALNPTALTVTCGETEVQLTDIPATTYTTNGNGVIYVAVPGFDNADVTLRATANGSTYIYEKENVTFANGSFAEINMSMTEYVDLGLSVYWAKTNIGAATETDNGYYFAWGEVAGYDSNGALKVGTHSVTTGRPFTVAEYSNPATFADAATELWGGNWRTPTKEEFAELVATKNNSNYTWTYNSTKKGWTVTYKTNGKSIFLPGAGAMDDGYFGSGYGYYASQTSHTSGHWYFGFTNSKNNITVTTDNNYVGMTIRPVHD